MAIVQREEGKGCQQEYQKFAIAATVEAPAPMQFVDNSCPGVCIPGPSLRDLDLLLAKFSIEIILVSAKQADIARKAFQRFGRGRHPAGLNFGDCFAYALAKDSAAPLLFKGKDFFQTDITVAPY